MNGVLDRARGRLPRSLVRRVDSYDRYTFFGTASGAVITTLSGLYPIFSADNFPGGVVGKVGSLVGLFLLGGYVGGFFGEAFERASIRRLCRENSVYAQEIRDYAAKLERSRSYHDSEEE